MPFKTNLFLLSSLQIIILPKITGYACEAHMYTIEIQLLNFSCFLSKRLN